METILIINGIILLFLVVWFIYAKIRNKNDEIDDLKQENKKLELLLKMKTIENEILTRGLRKKK